MCKKGTDKIIGGSVVSERAGEQISEISTAIHAGMKMGDITKVRSRVGAVAGRSCCRIALCSRVGRW